MSDTTQADVKPDAAKAKAAEAPAVDSGGVDYAPPHSAPIGQHAPRQFTAPHIVQLQRTIGNHATNSLMRQLQPTPPVVQQRAPDTPLQRASATVKGKMIGKTSIVNARNQVVAKAAKNTVLEVYENSPRLIGSGSYYRLKTTYDEAEGMLSDITSAFDENEAYIAVADVTVAPPRPQSQESAPEESSSDPASLEIELFEGHKFVITPESAKLEGELEKSLEADLPSVDLSIEIPIPAAPGVYVSAGLEITPSLGLAAKLAYALEKNMTETKFNIEAELGGSAGLDITAKALVGVGLANVAGISGGLFAEGSASAGIKGKLAGEVVQKTGKVWKSSSLKLSIEAEASIVGAVGAMIQAKLGPFSASKKYKLKEKEFAKFEWKREGLNIEKQGIRMSDIMPKMSDFKMLVTRNSPPPVDEVSETTPLLNNGDFSDDYD